MVQKTRNRASKCDVNCATASALDVIGDRWSLLLLRDYIFMGRREYGDFAELMEGISTNILASRLAWFCEAGIFIKHRHPTNKKKYYYEITDKGLDFLPVVMEMARWSWKHVPGAYTPPELKKEYVSAPDKFVENWRERVRKTSEDYLERALKA